MYQPDERSIYRDYHRHHSSYPQNCLPRRYENQRPRYHRRHQRQPPRLNAYPIKVTVTNNGPDIDHLRDLVRYSLIRPTTTPEKPLPAISLASDDDDGLVCSDYDSGSPSQLVISEHSSDDADL